MGVACPRGAAIFHRHRLGTSHAPQRAIFAHRIWTDEGGIGTLGALQQGLKHPDGSDANNMSHLMGDDVVKGSTRFHLLQIIGIESHLALCRQEGRSCGASWSHSRWAGLTENVIRPINWCALSQNQEIFDNFAIDHDFRKTTGK